MDINPHIIHTFSHHTFQSKSAQSSETNSEKNKVSEKQNVSANIESVESNNTSLESKQTEENKSSLNPQDRLTEEQLREIEKLRQRDQEVKTHEAAHLAAAGQYAKGGPSFSYERGPDGKSYAVGGEVNIDTSKISNDPEATLRKAQQIQAAATAPAEPSSQDRKVAAEAMHMAAEARLEIQQQQMENLKTTTKNDSSKETDLEDDKNNQKEDIAASTYESVANFDPEKKSHIFKFIV